jgi:hypothetical protein
MAGFAFFFLHTGYSNLRTFGSKFERGYTVLLLLWTSNLEGLYVCGGVWATLHISLCGELGEKICINLPDTAHQKD